MRKDKMDVISLPVEFDRSEIDSRYRFVVAVIKRAKELHQGAVPEMPTRARKVTTAAIEEVLCGAVRVLTGEAALEAEKAAGKLTYENMMDEAKQKVSFPDKPTDLRKDLEDFLLRKTVLLDEEQ
ncbi:MAG: DNA-directed RNA polymerase subunit omega [Deferribacteres bacterium]|nr:DNA-directed RNA polymerase subunit omega [Deferribacteres bacterium]